MAVIWNGAAGSRLYSNTMVHIGTLIKAEFDKQPRSHTVTWFARQLNCNRGNIYNIFSRSTIDTQLLMRISQILAHDFFSDLSESYSSGVEESKDNV